MMEATQPGDEPKRRGWTPLAKLFFALMVAGVLIVPLMMAYALVWDRQQQAQTGRDSIALGWGGPQVMAGPVVVIPYRAPVTRTETVNGNPVDRTVIEERELFLAPSANSAETKVTPERRSRSIYETVIYSATTSGNARFAIPTDLERYGIARASLQLDRAELRFGVSDPRGLTSDRRVAVDGRVIALKPGKGLGAAGDQGFFAFIDEFGAAPITVDYRFTVRGHESLTLVPQGGETRWAVTSDWPHPGFGGDFLPNQRRLGDTGFTARYAIPDLALGRPLVMTEDQAMPVDTDIWQRGEDYAEPVVKSAAEDGGNALAARIQLIDPVDLYSRVERAVKYGFLFIGFTFAAFLLFDLVGGVTVSPAEYLLSGAGLVLFFVLLLAFAEVIGFTAAYLLASAAIIGLLTAYSAAVLKSWRRAGVIGAMLTGLYGVLYVLLSLEAWSLLIGSVLLFAALAGLMYLTRRIDWNLRRA